MKKNILVFLLTCSILVSLNGTLANDLRKNDTTHPNISHDTKESPPKMEVVHWNWIHVGPILTITVFIVLSGLGKVAFHYAHFISSRIPESCLLILVGTVMGAIIYNVLDESGDFHFPDFTSELFFFTLLPPIILEASYSLYDRAFFDNLSTILLMAVVGTLFNFVMIGLLLYGVFQIGAMGKIRRPLDALDVNATEFDHYTLGPLEIALFSSLISAVDPVAVLAIFQEVGVNPDLYFLVFGESLLNDGVAVVLYNMMNTFNEMNVAKVPIDAVSIILGLVSFLTISIGGLIIGIVSGFLTALITRTTSQVRVVEPLALLGMAYLAYIMAELFHWSGIISLIGCGLVQAHYSFKNISKKSYTTVKYFIKMASTTSDSIIFLFLGIALVKGSHNWHTGFVTWTLTFCLIVRFLGVYGLTWLANRTRVKKINLQEQFIMAYGGLRGAVGFSLVEMINRDVVPPKQMFVTTTLAIIMFTVFFQGGTIKFLVNLLGIDKKKDEDRLVTDEVNDTVMEHLMAGIEIISGKHGHQYIGNVISYFDEKYFMKWFCRDSSANDLTRLYEKLAIADHLCNLYGPTIIHEEKRGEALLNDLTEDMFADYQDPSDRNKQNEYASSRDSHRPLLTPTPDLDVFTEHEEAGGSTPPPPLHPRSRTISMMAVPNFFTGNFRVRAATETSGSNLGLPSPDHSRRPSRDEVEAARLAFRQNSFARFHQKYNPNLINDDDQELTSHLRKRHAAARKISQIVLNSQDVLRPISPGSLLGRDEARKTKHVSLMIPDPTLGVPNFSDQTGESFMNDQLLRVPSHDRLGVQAVLARHGLRVRSMSMSSDRSGYSGTIPSRKQSEMGSRYMDETELPRSASPTDSTTSNGSSNAPKRAPRRKHTPHPMAPPIIPQQGQSGLARPPDFNQPNLMKLSTLMEGEEKGSREEMDSSKQSLVDK